MKDLGSSCEGWEKLEEEEEDIEELEIEEDDAFKELQSLDQYLKYPNQNQIQQNQINQIQISQNQIRLGAAAHAAVVPSRPQTSALARAPRR